MSMMNLRHTMERIKTATLDSPIAVFKSDLKGFVNTVFGATVQTQRLIAANDPSLIGVYDGSMNLLEIERQIQTKM